MNPDEGLLRALNRNWGWSSGALCNPQCITVGTIVLLPATPRAYFSPFMGVTGRTKLVWGEPEPHPDPKQPGWQLMVCERHDAKGRWFGACLYHGHKGYVVEAGVGMGNDSMVERMACVAPEPVARLLERRLIGAGGRTTFTRSGFWQSDWAKYVTRGLA